MFKLEQSALLGSTVLEQSVNHVLLMRPLPLNLMTNLIVLKVRCPYESETSCSLSLYQQVNRFNALFGGNSWWLVIIILYYLSDMT